MLELYLLIFVALMLVFSMYMFLRNMALYNWFTEKLMIVHSKCERDIALDKEWAWRYDYIKKLNYNEMFYKFWRRFDSFIEDPSFLED